MNWDDLRYVLAVQRAGTLVGAATGLGVNATTVSRRLRALEADLGTQVFTKLKHGAVLSAAGEELVSVAATVAQLVDDLDARIQGLDARVAGPLRVTAPDMLLERWMPDFAAFQEAHPDIELELLSSYEMVDLTRREADVAIRMAREAPAHLIGRAHVELLFAVYGAPALVERIGPEAAYDAFPWIGWDLSVGRATDAYLEEHHPNARIVLRVNTMRIMQQALRQGLGLTILPCFAGDPLSGLRRVGTYFEGGTSLWLLTHPELRGAARVRAFLERVRDLIARDRALFLGEGPGSSPSRSRNDDDRTGSLTEP